MPIAIKPGSSKYNGRAIPHFVVALQQWYWLVVALATMFLVFRHLLGLRKANIF
jgi:hypothetical protein